MQGPGVSASCPVHGAQTWGSMVRSPGFKACLCHLLAVLLWSSRAISAWHSVPNSLQG